MKQKLIMENWRRFLKEEKGLTVLESFERALEEATNNPQVIEEASLASTVFGIFMALAGQGGSDIIVNGDLSISPEEAAKAVQMLNSLDDEKFGDIKSDAIEDLGELAQAMKDGKTEFELKDGSGPMIKAEEGELFALKALEKADTGTSGGSSDTTDSGQANFKITKGESPQGDLQLKVELPKGKKLSQQEIAKIAKANGITGGYSTINNSGTGLVIITAAN